MSYPVIQVPKDEFLGSRSEWLTPSEGQTEFTGLTYTPGFLDVFVNGVKLGSDSFTATDGTTFTLTEAVTDQDHVAAISWFKGDMVAVGAIYPVGGVWQTTTADDPNGVLPGTWVFRGTDTSGPVDTAFWERTV